MLRLRLLFARVAFAAATLTLVAVFGCHRQPSDGQGGGTGGEGGSHPPPTVTVTHPSAPPLPGFATCDVTITENAAFEGHTHRPVCTPITYVSNPPTSGDHWPVWAQYKQYDTPVPRQMLVHDLEHGAIVMMFKCPNGCADVVTALVSARDAFGADPLCVTTNPDGPAARFVITPDTQIPTPLAISAWRASYTATCIDPDSLRAFVAKHYGHGTEAVCADGKDPADPLSGVPACSP
ncbi:MAG: DUF3105 domain-containing protein [Polyangiaceae bacterium]